MRYFATLSALVAGAYAAFTPTPTVARRDSSPFVSTKNGQFVVNGSTFRFVGTNAYWLPFLPNEDDISAVLANMAASNITVVRTWGFNDVTEIPTDGSPWLQLLAPNGTTVINNGTDGLQRLDRFVDLAAQHGIHVLFSLTNNWNPVVGDTLNPGSQPSRRDVPAPSVTRPRNFLSNDYGGMDAYVRALTPSKLHSEFFTDKTVRAAFQNYTQTVIARFSNNPWVLAWELANDPRCNSTITTSEDCTTNTVTSWHEEVGSFVKTVDPNHLVSSGASGFTCATCPKLFPINPPKPAASGSASRKKRASLSPMEQIRRVIAARKRSTAIPADGVKIRGRWVANKNAKRQDAGSLGSSFDGSTGVDSSDILNAPSIGFGSLQYFPDQNSYSSLGQSSQASSPDASLGQATIGPDQLNFSQALQQGIDFIQMSATQAQAVGKPLALTGFGLVTQENAPFFVPFNSTNPLLNSSLSTATLSKRQSSPAANASTLGVTQEQQNTAYSAWLQAGVQAGLGGLVQWQWSAGNLTAGAGGLVQANTTTTGGSLGQGDSPNDGYGGLGQQTNVQGELGQATLNLTST